MGFEQLAELRDRLRAERQPEEADRAKDLKRKPSPQAKPRIPDPAVEAIRPLQKHFPLAFHFCYRICTQRALGIGGNELRWLICSSTMYRVFDTTKDALYVIMRLWKAH